jgi:hypothetical protein
MSESNERHTKRLKVAPPTAPHNDPKSKSVDPTNKTNTLPPHHAWFALDCISDGILVLHIPPKDALPASVNRTNTVLQVSYVNAALKKAVVSDTEDNNGKKSSAPLSLSCILDTPRDEQLLTYTVLECLKNPTIQSCHTYIRIAQRNEAANQDSVRRESQWGELIRVTVFANDNGTGDNDKSAKRMETDEPIVQYVTCVFDLQSCQYQQQSRPQQEQQVETSSEIMCGCDKNCKVHQLLLF